MLIGPSLSCACAGTSSAPRFSHHLPNMARTTSLICAGTSSAPFDTDKPKDAAAFKDFFCKILLAPLPTYQSRLIMWVKMLENVRATNHADERMIFSLEM